MDKQLIIGLGTGRCGTVSLSGLLMTQCVNATHEHDLLPWQFNHDGIDKVLSDIMSRKGDRVSDTAFYYLPYVPYIIKKYPEVKFICLRRNMEATVNSYMKKTEGRNHWCVNHDMRTNKWDEMYPTYRLTDKRESVETYWTEYYIQSIEYENLYPESFKIFETEDVLNKKSTQLELFKFLNIDNYTVSLSIKENVLLSV